MRILVLAGFVLSGPLTPAFSQSVSFSKDVASILQLHCTSCHHQGSQWWSPGRAEAAGGLDTSTYELVMKGGDNGRVVVAGSPERSALLEKAVQHDEPDMPSPAPLSEPQIGILRSWIDQGIQNDEVPVPQIQLEVENFKRERLPRLRVSCRILSEGFLEAAVVDPANGGVLSRLYATVKWEPSAGEQEVGEWVTWQIPSDPKWPTQVTVRLGLSYTQGSPTGTVFIVGDAPMFQFIDIAPNKVSTSIGKKTTISFSFAEYSNLSLIISKERRRVYTIEDLDVPPGRRSYQWDLKERSGRIAPPGRYIVDVTLKSRDTGTTFGITGDFELLP